MALTPKQQRFVAEYLVDLNATQAAIRYHEEHVEAWDKRYRESHMILPDDQRDRFAARHNEHMTSADHFKAMLAAAGRS